MLAVVDSNLLFTYVNMGASDHCNDASVNGGSNLYDVIRNDMYSKHYIIVNNVKSSISFNC